MYSLAVTRSVSSDLTANTPGVLLHRVVLFVLWLIFYGSFTLYRPALLDDADSVHAEVAREMLLRHDWVTLYANGIRYLEKAPLYYWSMAASMKVFGISAAAARLPLALSMLALALLMEAFARRAFNSERAGLYAGLFTLSSFGLFIFTRINIPDALVCLWLMSALFCFWLADREEHPPRVLCLGFAAFCALNVLTKGLIGIVFPVAIAAIYSVLTRGFGGTARRLARMHLLSSLAVFLAIAVPWHVLAGLANPTQGNPGSVALINGHWSVPLPTDGNVHGWAWFYFVNEQVLRYLNLRVPRDYDTVPLVLFWALCLVWLAPWSAFAFHAFAHALPVRTAAWRQRFRSGSMTPDERTNLLLVIATLLPLLFFSLSTRQEYYVLPSLPPLILLIACWLDGATPTVDAKAARSAERIGVWMLIAASALAGVCTFFALRAHAPAANADLAAALVQNPGSYALSFGHFLDLTGAALGFFRVPLLLSAIAIFGAAFAHYKLRRSGSTHAALLSLAAGAFVFLAAAHQGLVIFSPTLSSEPLARAIAPLLKPNDMIAIHGEYEAGSTLGFYLQRTDLHLVEGRSSNLWYGSFFPDAPHIFETRESIVERWRGPQRIFLWEDPADPDRPSLNFDAPVHVIARSGGKVILSNQP